MAHALAAVRFVILSILAYLKSNGHVNTFSRVAIYICASFYYRLEMAVNRLFAASWMPLQLS